MVGMDDSPASVGGAPAPRDGTGTPVGRRVVLGMVGLGALGVLFGRYAQDAVSTIVSNDPTGITSLLPGAEGFRYYSVTVTEPYESPSPAASRARRPSRSPTCRPCRRRT